MPNVYDQIATGSAPTRSIYDDIADEEIHRSNQAVSQSVAVGMESNPDQAGEAQRLAPKVGVGPDVAQHQLDEVRKQAALKDVQERDLAAWNPILARQLSDPNFAAIAHDQVDNLSAVGKIFQSVKDASAAFLLPGAKQGFADTASGKEMSSAYDRGADDFELGMLGIKVKRGDATAGDWNRIDELQARRMSAKDPQTLIGKTFGGVASMAGNLLPIVPRSLVVGGQAAMAGAAAGGIAGAGAFGVGAVPGIIAGATSGFGLGFESEFGAQSYEMMAGNTYLDLLGKGVDENRAQWAAGLVGAANTALQLGAMKIAGKPVARLMDRAFTGVMGESIAEEMTRPTVAKAIRSAVLNWSKNSALGATDMALQTATSRMGEDWAKKMDAGEITSDLFSNDFAREFGKSWVDAAVTMGVINSFSSMTQLAAESQRANRAVQAQQFFENLNTNASESKVRERNPDSYQNYIQQQAESAGAENVYVDGKAMANVLHQSGLAVEQVEQVIPGISEKIAEAADTGGDVVIPTSQFATHLAGTDIGNALTPHLRLDPEAMSAAEAQEFQSRQNEIFAEASKQAAEQAATNEDFAKSAKVVEKDVFDQLKATNTMPDDMARTNAQFVRDFVVTQAARQNMTPEAFFDKYRYTIQRAAGADADEATLEHSAILRQNGDFGPKHEQFYHDAKGAVERLLADKNGEAIAALHHPEVGDIDLIYGQERNSQSKGFGLAKIAQLHPEVMSDLQGFLDKLHVISKSENRVRLADDSGMAVVRLAREDSDQPWLMTAFARKGDALSAAEGGRTAVTNRAEPAPENPAGQEANNGKERVAQNGTSINEELLHQETRGGFDPSTLTTMLGEKADMSTFLHESAHYFLSVYADMAKDDTGEIRGDMDKLLNWFGVKDLDSWNAMSLEEQRKYHEQFAYSYERYLAEGKAPSVEAQGIFDRFTQWLKRVYKSVRDDINTIYRQQHGEDLPILTGEVRDVMDRMLASDEQIKQAEAVRNMEPVFKSQDASGMNDAEWKVYQDMAQTATDTASQELGQASVREMQWLSTAKGRLLKAMQAQHEALREDVRKQVREDIVKSDPVYKAQHFLRTGEMEGEDRADIHKMDTAAVNALVPEGASKDKLFGMTKRGGLDPDHVAAAMGFRDGKEMIDAILAAPSLKDATESATNQKMLAEHGVMATPEGMRREVEKAVHNEARARLIAFELRHAFNMSDSERVLVKAAQQTARKMLSQEKFSDINPRAYAAREARAARQAQAAATRGDVEGVGRFKREQLLQNALTSEALKVKDEADKHLRYINKFDNPSKAITKAIGADHVDAINELLAGYGLSPRERYSQRSESMEAWVQQQYDRTGVMPAVPPDLINRMGTMHWKDMTIDQLRDLRDAVKSLDYTGRKKTELTIAGQQATVDEIIHDVQDSLRDMKHTPVSDIRARREYAKGLDKLSVKFLDKKSWIRSADAALLKMEQLFQWIDAGKDAGAKEAPIEGPMQRIFRLATAAESKERGLRAEAVKAMRDLQDKLGDAKIDLRDSLDVPELSRDGDTHWYRGELISMALNMGNESNKEKLLRGYGWSEFEAVSAINRLLSKTEMDFVQGVWDHLASYGKEIVELERRQTGVMPKMVEPSALVTKHGVYPGGYYPVVYNDVLDYKAAENQARNADRLFENNFSQPSTASGHTVARTGYVGPLYLSLGVISRHIDQVTHDLSWREPIIDMNKVLSDERLMREVDQVYGREYSKQFRPWLQAMANDRVFNTVGDSAWEGFVRKVRSNVTMVGIGFRMSTMAIHGTSALSNSIGEVGAKWFAKGMNQFMGADRIRATRDFVYDRSPEMAHRMDEADRNVHEAISDINRQQASLDKITSPAKLYADVRKFAFRGVGMLDLASALPTWMGAYLKGMAKEADGGLNLGEDDAIEYANRAVRNAHGGGGAKDLSAVQRDKGIMSLATMFYSYWNHVYNRQRDLGKGLASLATGNGSARDFPKLLARSWFYIVVPQVAHTLLASHSQNQDDNSLGGFAEEVAKGIGLGFVSGVPILRDISSAAVHGRDYTISPLESAGNTLLHTIEDAGKVLHGEEPSSRFTQNAAETAGYALGLPLAQPAASAKFLWDVIDGDAHPKDISDWWKGLLSGKLK